MTSTYDPAGNRLILISPAGETMYAYDALNRLISSLRGGPGGADEAISYRYDGLGRRIEKVVQGLSPEGTVPFVTRYVYDNEDIILELLNLA